MSSYDILQNSFPSGEISPLWRGRSNTEFYQTGLELCRNFMPMNPSGLRRRPGTRYLMDTYMGRDAVLHFVSDGEQNLVYEITYGHVRVWDVGAPGTIIAEANSSHLNYANIHSVQMADNKGMIWLAEPNYPVTTIRLSGSAITVDRPSFTSGNESIFNGANKYPASVGFTGGRLVLGFPNNAPNAIFLSRTPDYSVSSNPDRYTDFTYYEIEVDKDGIETKIVDDSHAIEIEDNELIRGYWFLNQTRFLVGSAKSVFMDGGGLVTPQNFDISPALREGSASINAKGLKNYAVFCGVSGKTLTLMVYDRDSEGYQSRELTTDSSHLFSPGIRDFEILFMPDPVIWVLLNNGTLLSCTISTSTGSVTTGWAMHPMKERDLQTISYGQRYDGRDELLITSKVGTQYIVEVLSMDDIFNEDEGFNYLDCAVERQFSTETDRVFFSTKFKGRKVSSYADGSILPEAVVGNDGYVDLPLKVKDITMGFTYESLAGFLSRELPTNGESSFANKRRLKKATLRVYQSLGGYIGIQHEKRDAMYKLLSERYGEYRYGEPVNLTDEDIATDIQSRNLSSANLYVATDFPTPLNILALKEKIELLET